VRRTQHVQDDAALEWPPGVSRALLGTAHPG
jgi:hypothetical protein